MAQAQFELTPKAGGGWTEKVLHSFNGKDGLNPVASLIFDASGNLYGTTRLGGSGTDCFGNGCGIVFELTPKAGADWTEKVLHTFHKNRQGWDPVAGVIFDAGGNLYGTTESGGSGTACYRVGCGTVFELTPRAGGGWTEKVLHNFNGKDGSAPNGLTFGASGGLYGTTDFGGRYYGRDCQLGCGVVFELTPKVGGGWTEKVLHNFTFNNTGGFAPVGSLIFDAAGNLYGMTAFSCAFELMPKAGGGWTEKVLHTFNLNGRDGWYPFAGLVFDAAGNLYGTTGSGGAYDDGTVFEITP